MISLLLRAWVRAQANLLGHYLLRKKDNNWMVTTVGPELEFLLSPGTLPHWLLHRTWNNSKTIRSLMLEQMFLLALNDDKYDDTVHSWGWIPWVQVAISRWSVCYLCFWNETSLLTHSWCCLRAPIMLITDHSVFNVHHSITASPSSTCFWD